VRSDGVGVGDSVGFGAAVAVEEAEGDEAGVLHGLVVEFEGFGCCCLNWLAHFPS
jgi:hypothetical protein